MRMEQVSVQEAEKFDVLSDFFIPPSERRDLIYHDTISRSGFIRFGGDRSLLVIYNTYVNSHRVFGGIVVEAGSVNMNFINNVETNFFIDDFFIKNNASITILMTIGPRIFVRKSSIHLGDALTKIHFWGNSEKAGVRNFNNEYWEIGVGAGFDAIPEPAAYGAAFSLGALGFAAWRRRGQRSLASAL